MVWLFGQIWLWLIVAFALGAGSAWLVLRATRRPEPEPEPYWDDDDLDHDRYPEEEAPAERTQFIPTIHEPARYSDDDVDVPEPAGHREGRLPLPPERDAQPTTWQPEAEPAWPEADDLPDATRRWPPAPHQPGRGG